jgi:hypothetical protein
MIMYRHTDRGVSTVVGYALTIGISSLLIVGLLVGVGGFVGDQRQSTIRDGMEVLGQQMAADLSAADRMVRVGGEEVRIERELPPNVVGTSYRIRVQDGVGASTELVLRTEDPLVQVRVTVRTETDIESTDVGGGDVVVVYDAANDRLEVLDD